MKTLTDLNLKPIKAQITPSDKEVYAEISFADFESLCNAAAIIDKSKING